MNTWKDLFEHYSHRPMPEHDVELFDLENGSDMGYRGIAMCRGGMPTLAPGSEGAPRVPKILQMCF